MPAILTFRFPLKASVKEEDIRLLVNQWIRVSRYYDFKDAFVSPDELESSSHSLKDDNVASLHHCQFIDKKTDTSYLAFRITNHDQNNFFWRSDVIYERNPKSHPWLLISHSRSIYNLDEPADCTIRIKYPTIVKLLFDHDMLTADHGLTLGNISFIRDLNVSELDTITSVFQDHTRTEFAFLYVYVPGFSRESFASITDFNELYPDDAIEQLMSASDSHCPPESYLNNLQLLLSIFSRVCHIYIASTEEEHQKWLLITSGIPTPRQQAYMMLSLPELNLYERISLDKDSDFTALYHQLIMLLQEFQQNLPLNYPAWETLPSLAGEESDLPEEESYYLYMNHRLANAIQKRRKELRMTQGDLAEQIQVTKMLVSRLERLQTIKVKRSVIQDLEKVLNVNPGTFLRLQGKDEETASDYETISAVSPAAETTRFCRFCGKQIPADSRFCSWCGKETY